MSNKALLIEKEEILGLHYPAQVSEKTADKKRELYEKCRRALSLGNLHKVKCTIFFTDVEGLKKVNTTIWGLYENYIELKGGVLINMRYIEDIYF